MRTRRSWRNQDRIYRSIGRELQAEADAARGLKDRYFSAVHATGIAYCDTATEENGDYLCVAFLPFRSLELEINRERHPLLPMIREDAAKFIARRGEHYPVSTCCGYVVLGK